jgi:hypothetical protein
MARYQMLVWLHALVASVPGRVTRLKLTAAQWDALTGNDPSYRRTFCGIPVVVR